MSTTPTIDPEFRRLIPPLLPDELARLEASIVAEGCRDALVTWRGVILDGHNRFAICKAHKIPFRTVAAAVDDRLGARIWILSNQLSRRNINDDQRSIIMGELVDDLAKQSKRARARKAVAGREQKAGRRPILVDTPTTKITKKARIRTSIAKLARVSERKVKQAQALRRRDPALAAKVRAGEVALRDAVRQTKPAVRAERLAATVWPDGKYGVILADPPWRPDDGVLDPSRVIENQYPTASLDELVAMRDKVAALALDDCVLLLWTTAQKVGEACALVAAWGFTVKSGAVWIKPSVGMGYWFRQRHELVILATRGTPLTPLEADRPDSVITADRRGHSEKPDEVYALVERMFPAIPKVEIFARASRPGWACATNETSLRSA